MTISAGTRLGPYEVLSPLGAGGMGEVYRARDTRLGREVAVKVVHPGLASDPDRLSRFEKEARAAAQLDHPNVLVVHDVGTHEGSPFIVSELLQGESLREKLGPSLPPKKAVDYAIQIARGLAAAHEKGIVHRDIKPENVFVTKDGHVKILDFGVAKLLHSFEASGIDTETPTATVTQPGTAVGTVAYMSPEQIRSQPVDARTDLFSFGVVFYEMLSGKRPFQRGTNADTMSAILREEPPDLSEINRGVTAALENVVRHCLAKEPEGRFQSARDVVFALEALPEVSTSSASAPMSPARIWLHRHRKSLAGSALLVVVLAVLGVLTLRHRPAGSGSRPPGPVRIAVLPFENLGGAEDGYFADGMTDEVRSRLTGLSGLAVIASASSNQYKATTKPAEQIARELGVGYLLVAKVRWQKSAQVSRIRVTPELVDVGGGGAPTTRWQETFDADLFDVFKMQGEIAARVAKSLDVVLSGKERGYLATRPTSNLEAYDAYLQGIEILKKPGINFIKPAMALFDQAVALDPGFALAWARSSLCHTGAYVLEDSSPQHAEAARIAAERAVELAPGLNWATVALWSYLENVKGDEARASEVLSHALKAAPDDIELLGLAAGVEQDINKKLGLFRRIEVLDPRSGVQFWIAWNLQILRRVTEARAACDRGLSLTPGDFNLVRLKVMTYLQEGDLVGARAVIAAAPKQIGPTELVAYFGTVSDLDWVLDDAQRDLLLRLTPTAFDDNRGRWGIVLAQAWSRRADEAKVREYAKVASQSFAARVSERPDDGETRALLGLSLAYLGRREEAVREGEQAVLLRPGPETNPGGQYLKHQLLRIYILTRNHGKALDLLETLLSIPGYLTPGWLRIDPNFDPLRKNPRFEKLVAPN